MTFVRFAALVVDLFVRPRGQKARERVDDRQRTAARHAGRHRDHVLLRDPALDESIGVAPGERQQSAVLDEIGVEDEQMRVLLSLRDERAIVGGHQVVGVPRLAPGIARARFGVDRRQAEAGDEAVGRGAQLGERGRVIGFARRAGVVAVQLPAFNAGPAMKVTP